MMKVNEVMTRGAECVRPNATLQEAARKMRDMDVGFLPVCGDNDRLAGTITDRDIAIRAVAEGWSPADKHVNDVLSADVIYCFEDQDAEEAADLMKQRQVRRLVVLNRDKRLVGVVSLGDLAVETEDRHLTGATLQKVSEPAAPRR